jgi:hypothetical protein
MQVQQVADDDFPLRVEKCRHCGRAVRAGQVVLVQHGYESYTRRDFVVHARCMRLLLDTAPPEMDQTAYEELRERILATGNAFPTEN